LLEEAERLFAQRGVHQATTREITEAAGQRNASALTYHFGSRSRLLYEILRRHGDPLDVQRAELAVEPLDGQPTRALVAALLLPYAGCLATPGGRNYLRIVAQLTDQFPVWRVESDVNPPNLRRILATLEARAAGSPAVARLRVVAAIMLMTTAMADRAELVERGAPLEVAPDEFVDLLADMLVAGLEAPVGPPLVAGPASPPEAEISRGGRGAARR
jgi:AcrR family transcriptional regulator